MSTSKISHADPKHLTASSNAIRLTGRQWLGIGVFGLALILFAPKVWTWVEPLDPEPDYRMPYDLSADYWLYDRYGRLAASRYDTLLIGDSVIWGQYVTRQQTLSHYLNELAGKERFANLGLDGAEPAALAGLLEYYAGGVGGKTVLLQCNPLWMSSPKRDLQDDEDVRINHPRLIPQFFPRIPCYKEEVSPRLSVLVERQVAFRGWTSHLQQAYYERKDIPSWTLEHPYDNPLEPLARGLPPSDNTLRHEPVDWITRGIRPQKFDWVPAEESIQWRCFQQAVEILQRKGNRVFVLVGPFNEHLVDPASRQEYQKVKASIEAWLKSKGVAYIAPPPLASRLYADASHPLAEGYDALAREVWPQLSDALQKR